MGSTPNRGYRYPVGTDTPSVVRDVKNLADDMDVDVELIIPAGMIVAYAGSTVPQDWLLCNGATFDTGIHPNLFAALGSDTVPDLVDRFLKGSTTVGATGGSKMLITANLPAHVHSTSAHTHPLPSHNHTLVHSHSGTTASNGNHRHALRDNSGRGSKNNSLVHNDNANTVTVAPMEYAGNHSHSFTTTSTSATTTSSASGTTSNNVAADTGSTGAAETFEPKFYALIYMIRAG